MFNIPVTVPFRDPEGVFPVDLSVNIDTIILVKPLSFDKNFGVGSTTLYSDMPSCELVFEDGRKLPIMETAATINRYLDLYRSIESFYTQAQAMIPDDASVYHMRGKQAPGRGVVIPLFGANSCDTSEASTPD